MWVILRLSRKYGTTTAFGPFRMSSYATSTRDRWIDADGVRHTYHVVAVTPVDQWGPADRGADA